MKVSKKRNWKNLERQAAKGDYAFSNNKRKIVKILKHSYPSNLAS